MTAHKGCYWKGLSRRQLLQSGLAAAVTGAIRSKGDAQAQSQAQGTAGQAMPSAGARALDIHAHYLPEAYLDVLNEDGKRFNAKYRMTDKGFYYETPAGSGGPSATKVIDLKQRIADMDRQGVAAQAVSLSLPTMAYWGDAELSHNLAKAWNDGASAAHRDYPTRLVGLLALPMPYPDRAIDELNRASKLPGIRGVYMGTTVNDKDLDDPMFEPIWARIEELNLPVFVHHVQIMKEERLHPFYLGNLLGNAFDTAIAACHLIFGGVLDRHPKLQIGLGNGGGTLLVHMGRLDRGWQVRPETRHLPNAPSAYLQRFTYDTIVHSKPILEFVISQVGAERVMIGTDYPSDMGDDHPIQFLEQINLTSAQRRTILGGAASKLLQL
jgi:aminocarboxymuconate-semialdehyde decarboxylase